MTNSMDRRAARAADPDAELLALQPEIDDAENEFAAALKPVSDAQERFYKIRDKLRSEGPTPPADPEWEQILASFAAQMAEYRKRAPRPEDLAYEEARKSLQSAEFEARLESGLAYAEQLEDEKSVFVSEIKDRMLAMSASTLAGLIFKAKYASERDYDPDVMASIIDDLVSMAEEA